MKLRYYLGLLAALCLPTPALAYLGGFNALDGYAYHPNLGGWIDVASYDAGQYGPFAGGGPGPNAIAPDSGLWKITSQAGGFFPTSATRTAQIGGAPPYPAAMIGTVPAYIVGDHPGGRMGGALALRNDVLGTGTMEYDYTLDSYDFGGIPPASVTSGNVDTEFYFCPNPVDPGKTEKFIMSFTDSAGSIGMQIGYQRDNEVYWRAGNAGPWNLTGIIADATAWDAFRVRIDLTNDDFGIRYYDTSAATWLTLATNVPLGNPMQDVTHLGWALSDSVSSGNAGKNLFDDFTVRSVVPEPSSFVLAGMAVVGLGIGALRRRKR